MLKQPARGRVESGGTGHRRTVAAAARAAAKRSERARAQEEKEPAEQRAPGPEARPLSGSGSDSRPDPGSGSQRGQRSGNQQRTSRSRGRRDVERAGYSGAAGGPHARKRKLRTVALAVLVLLGVTASALLGWWQRDGEETRQARAQALDAARKAAPEILSYRHQHLEEDFARARAHLTGGFREEYARTTQKVVGPTAEKYKGNVKATIAKPPSGGTAAASVVSASPERVVVLLFMNQVTKNTQTKGPRVDLNRVRMTLVPTGEGWKVSAVDAL